MVTRTLRFAFSLALTLALAAAVSPRTAARSAAWPVPAGGNLQAVLDAAQPGDTILLEAGATYVGNFVLPAKGGASYITIRSAAPESLVPGGSTRIDPAHASYLPKLRSPNNQPALATAPGAHHYRLQLLELQANAGGAGTILALGDGGSAQHALHQVPHSLVVDRVYIHGDPANGQKRGIALNSGSTSIVNSYIAEIKAVGQDSQAIGGWNGPGPYLIANNYLEAAGENIMFGGADPAIPGLVPSDITISGNHLRKPLGWRGQRWSVKNLLELKSAQRVSIDRNILENNWQAAQAGYAVLFKSVNQDGGAPWSVVQHVEFTNNIVRHVSSAINILGRDTRYPSLEANHITVRNNLFEDVSGARYGGSGRFLLINGGRDITIDHNTVINDGSSTVFADGRPTPGFVFTNNIVPDNGMGVKGSGSGIGLGTVERYFPGGLFLGGVFAGARPGDYPTANYYPGSLHDVGFVDLAGGNYRLAPSSPFRGASTEGRDVGCQVDALPGGTGFVPPPQPSPGVAPGAPANLAARVDGATVTLSWMPPGHGGKPTSYRLEAGTAPGRTDVVSVDTGSAQTALVAQSVPAGVYYLALRAVNAAGASPRSSETVVVVGGAAAHAGGCLSPPGTPGALAAGVNGLTVTLTWQPGPGCPDDRFVVEVGSAPGRADLMRAPVGTARSVATSGAAGRYYVRVVAENARGRSAPSNEILVTLTP